MRILVLSNIDIGLYKFRIELLEMLVRKHEVYFSVPEGDYIGEIERVGCKYIPCKFIDRRGTNPIKDIRLFNFYRKMIQQIRPSIVLTYTIKPNIYGGFACQILKIPYIVNVTGLGTSIEMREGVIPKISLTLYKAGLRKAKCVFFQNNDNMKSFVDKRIVQTRTRLIPGSGVNLEKYSLEAYPSNEGGIRFLFVGRIMKEKGIEELLTTINDIHKKEKNIILDIVGPSDEDYLQQLKEAEIQGSIVYHGFQSDILPFYKRCHCVVLPSYHEGMSNVMLEASATGRPVITTRIPGCEETFEEGLTGFGCAAKDADSLKEAMMKFLTISQKEREQMGIAARKKIMQEYDRNIVLRAYEEEIDALATDI